MIVRLSDRECKHPVRLVMNIYFQASSPKLKYSAPVPATWVRRPFEEDGAEQMPEGKAFLSDFQVEKFTYYFTDVFDHNKDRVITIEDIQALNEVCM